MFHADDAPEVPPSEVSPPDDPLGLSALLPLSTFSNRPHCANAVRPILAPKSPALRGLSFTRNPFYRPRGVSLLAGADPLLGFSSLQGFPPGCPGASVEAPPPLSFTLLLAEAVSRRGLRSFPLPPDWLASFEAADPPEISVLVLRRTGRASPNSNESGLLGRSPGRNRCRTRQSSE